MIVSRRRESGSLAIARLYRAERSFDVSCFARFGREQWFEEEAATRQQCEDFA
jgi:hypothetical protein